MCGWLDSIISAEVDDEDELSDLATEMVSSGR